MGLRAVPDQEIAQVDYETIAARYKAETDHLFFTRYFFKTRHGARFRVNWHHHVFADAVQAVMDGRIPNLVINVPPGSTKTEEFVIAFMARGLAITKGRAKFLHLSYSDELAGLNSQTARDLVQSDAYQKLWPLKISNDSNSKHRWNVLSEDGQISGGVYATSMKGAVTGFRAGHMEEGFTGAIIIDDPVKAEDAFSKANMTQANRALLTTVESRRANPSVPVVLIMQRVSDDDPSGFVLGGNLPGEWVHIKIPALMDKEALEDFEQYDHLIDSSTKDKDGRFSYWPYKEPLERLLTMERGEGTDKEGGKISRFVFGGQYQQNPRAMGGNILKGEYFKRYKILPKIKYRKIFADTAQKTKERNDYSVFECWGLGTDGLIYLIDMIRGKWEAPELERRAEAFWIKHADKEVYAATDYGNLREMKVEDKSSGTGLIQSIKAKNAIPIKGVEREKDKYTRANDTLPYLEARMIALPEDAPFTNDFIAEAEAFTADDSHKFDDQIDPMFDAVDDMLGVSNKLKKWEQLGK